MKSTEKQGTAGLTKLVSALDDDEYSPSTPTRGNHSIYPTLALQGKAVSPTSPTHLVCDPLFAALRISYSSKLSLQYFNRIPAYRQKIDKTPENLSYDITTL